MSSLTHFDAQGQAHMVDVAAKEPTARAATAHGRIALIRETYQQHPLGPHELKREF